MPLSNQINSSSSNHKCKASQLGIHHPQEAFSNQPNQYNFNSMINESGYDQHMNSMYDTTLIANN